MERHAGAALGLGLVLFYTLLGVGFSQVDDFFALPAPARAAWVGALGSITSIVVAAAVAVSVSVYNNRQTLKRERAVLRANRAAVLGAMNFVHWRFRMTIQAIGKPNVARSRVDYLIDMLDRAIEGFESLNPAIIADEQGVMDYYRFRNTVTRFRRRLYRIADTHRNSRLIVLQVFAMKLAVDTLKPVRAEHRRIMRFRKRYDLDRSLIHK